MNYSKIYQTLINKRRKNPYTLGYSEKHHIIPKSLGGTDNKTNIVVLSGREHWIAHLLLHKIYRQPSTAHACNMMAMRCEERGIPYIKNSKTYEYIRKEHSKHMAGLGKKRIGKKNGSFGTVWICNIELRQNKKIPKDEIIPNGWVKGRNKWKKLENTRIKRPHALWVTNGKKNKCLHWEDQTIPDGYYEGFSLSTIAQTKLRNNMIKHNKSLRGTSGQGGWRKK